MSTFETQYAARDPDDLTVRVRGWLRHTEAWLDARGRAAWIAVMVLGFIAFWPVGLAILAYMIWSKRMSSNCSARRHTRSAARSWRAASRSSGNQAFDAYRAETLRRLEDEQAEFEAFLHRLREARDKAEFDQFMDDRSKRGPTDDDERSERSAA